MTTNKQSWHAQAAALIKKDLQARYPLIKFAVKSDMYSVRACWTDGPTAHDVEQVMNPYTNGTFDGMTDCFNYAKSAKPVSVNYVFADREYSDTAREAMREYLCMRNKSYRGLKDSDRLTDRPYGIWEMGQLIDHELQDVDLTKKPYSVIKLGEVSPDQLKETLTGAVVQAIIKPLPVVCLTPPTPSLADTLIDTITHTDLDEPSPFTDADVDRLTDALLTRLVQQVPPPENIKFVVGK